ncbi:MAG: 5-formyltetrahydrofolate cyclo-ligase [Lachnospiraceae bacterium]|nr:5-formyltetrahydrofolate cyclo-ligase [Lachnospiraceae bacterium]
MSETENRKEQKRSLRRQILAQREAMAKDDVTKKSAEITKQIVTTSFYQNAACVYAYVDTRNEYQTTALIEQAWKDGKRVAVPKVEGRDMSFYYIRKWEDLEEGFKGIREPKKTSMLAQEDDALMILPGAAYDQQGNRIGYGGGFYDRYLSVHKGHIKLAPAYEFQVMETLPSETFDQKVFLIITEKRLIDLNKGGRNL